MPPNASSNSGTQACQRPLSAPVTRSWLWPSTFPIVSPRTSNWLWPRRCSPSTVWRASKHCPQLSTVGEQAFEDHQVFQRGHAAYQEQLALSASERDVETVGIRQVLA